MAQQVKGRRDVVQNPLQQRAQQPMAERSVQLTGVRSPSMPSMAGFTQQRSELQKAMGGLDSVLEQAFEDKKDEWITEGKTAYMTGVTEQELMKNGNRYTQMGYQQLKARNDVNEWYLREQADILEKSKTLPPEEYQKYLGERRKAVLDSLQDPYAKKVAVAAFEQINPDLAKTQFVQNNAYNMDQREAEVMRYLDTGSIASPTAGRVVPGETTLKVSPTPVGPVMQLSVRDRDIGIKTLIGEAGNQGEFGMAAVAHVMRNRATDNRYPPSIAGVSLQKNQFSVWNKGKEGRAAQLNALGPGNPVYDKAAKVFDVVMAGRHVDPTGGALFYHSPAGMKAYAQQGVRVSAATKARTSAAERDANSIRIGGHVFYGKSNGLSKNVRAMVEPSIVEPTEQGDTGYRDPMVSSPNYDPEKALGPASTKDTISADIVNQENAQVAQNEGVTGITEAGAPNETLDFIHNYKGLPKDKMAKAVAGSMARQLDAGTDTLWNDTGGLSVLYDLGADASDIDKVTRARQRYEAKKEKEYDEADLKFEDEVMRMADDPDADPDEIRKLIGERVKSGQLMDAQGAALARSAAATIRQNEGKLVAADQKKAADDKAARESVFSNSDFLGEVGGLYQQIGAGTIDMKEAVAEAKEIGDKYGASGEDVQKLIGTIFTKDQERQTSLRNKAEAALASTAESNQRRAEVDGAISRGYGLNQVTGEVKIKGEDGNIIKMSAKEYGIEELRKQSIINNTVRDPNGELQIDSAGVVNEFFTKLQAQDVVDNKTQAQMRSAVLGNIVDPKTNKVTKDAMEAYDTYTMLRTNPTITDEYVSRVVSDPYTRNLMELAYKLDAGNLTGPDALVRAKALLDDPNYVASPSKLAENRQEYKRASSELVKELTEPSFGTWITGFYDSSEVERAQKNENTINLLTTRLADIADGYMAMYPSQDPKVAIELAKQDLKRDTKYIAGSVMLIPHEQYQKMKTDMGISDKYEVSDVVRDFVKDYHKELFGEAAEAQMNEKYGTESYPSLPVTVRWMPNIGPNGSFQIMRIKDEATGAIDMARPQVIPVEEFRAYHTTKSKEQSVFQTMFNEFGEFLGTGIRNNKVTLAAQQMGAMADMEAP